MNQPSSLVRHLQSDFALDWHGIHGLPHWERVRENGLRLAAATGANPHVVELFAYLHDCRRQDERADPGHGARAAEFLVTLRGAYFEATDAELELLVHACRHHSDGLMEGEATVLTCWDADRLDLWRVGTTPQARFLCTAAAREPEVLAWSRERSLRAWGA